MSGGPCFDPSCDCCVAHTRLEREYETEIAVHRTAFDEIMSRSWDDMIDGGDVEGILERHQLLVPVPADWDTLSEYESSMMQALRWNVVNAHELTHLAPNGPAHGSVPQHCRWCDHPWDAIDQNVECIDRLRSEAYKEIHAEGGVWDPSINEWHVPDLDL